MHGSYQRLAGNLGEFRMEAYLALWRPAGVVVYLDAQDNVDPDKIAHPASHVYEYGLILASKVTAK